MALLEELFSHQWVRTLFWFAVFAAATVACERVAVKLTRRVLRSDENPLPSSSIIVNIVRGAVWIVGASVILDSCFNVRLDALITGLGVVGIAVSLGFQDTLSNLIGGLQVTFMRIVKPGDNIEVGTETGVVRDVSWRHTTIENNRGETVIIPNSIISKNALVHLPPASSVTVPFAVATSEKPMDEVAGRIAKLAQEAVEAEVCPIVSDPPVKVLFSEITEYGFKGKVIMQIDDPALVAAAVDAVVRAIAPETR